MIAVLLSAIVTFSIPMISPPISGSSSVTYDKDGVPLVDYGEMSEVEIGLQRNPVTVAHTANRSYYDYLHTGDAKTKQIFLNNANWLANNAIIKNNEKTDGLPVSYSLLEYEFPFPPYNLSSPWRSAMAQGLAVNTLVMAHQLTGNDTYIDLARQMMNALFIDIEDGGVTYKNDSEGGWWYEEYAGEGGLNPRVLNGMQFTLLGIYNFYNYTGDANAKYLFDKGVDLLKRQLPLYDHNQTYSAYDRFGGYAPYGYHRIHVDLLEKLYDMTRDETFKKYHDLWGKFILPK